jgi:hypothetical protein
MTASHKLEFIPNPANESEGKDSGIEIFRGSPYASTARECGQNSADAAKTRPVEINFDHIEIQASELPDLDEYRKVVSLCLEKVKKKNDTEGITFFSQAQDVLNNKTIAILVISDLNTKGLRGPNIDGTPFHSLLKGSGVSEKESLTAGGSFGIGKKAAFAISELQTVFYSTLYEDSSTGKEVFLTQGKSIFFSHIDEKQNSKRSLGFWGKENFEPISDPKAIPEWMRRSKIGTSLHVIGFRVTKNWHFRMAASLITNFFSAIYKNEMKFSLNNGEIVINSQTLLDLFKNPDVINGAEESHKTEDFELSRNLLECLTSNETVEEELTIDGLGKISVRILMREGLKKNVVIIRNGMVITDNLKNFGDSFRRFPMYSDFVALVEPVDDEGNRLIRTLENPSHDELSSERIRDEKKKLYAFGVMKKLAKQVRETIKKEAQKEPEDEVEIDELSEFFADSNDSDKLPDPEAETNPETYTYKLPKKPKKKDKPVPVPIEEEGEEGGAGGKDDSEEDGGSGEGKGDGDGTGGKGKKRFALPISIQEMRNIPLGNSHKRRIFFTSDESCRAQLRISASGLSDKEDLFLKSSNEGKIEKGKLSIDLKAGERKSLDIEFAEEYEGPIELVAINTLEGGNNEN